MRFGGGRAPAAWRNVIPGTEPAAFNFHSTTITAPVGTVVEALTWDNSQGVERNHDLVMCGFIIPIGPLTGHRADFRASSSPPAVSPP